MILTLQSGKSPVYIRELDIVKPHPNGGATVWAAGDRFMVVEGFDTIMAMMAQPNTPSQPAPSQPTPAPRPAPAQPNMAMTFMVLGQEVEVDPATAPALVHWVNGNSACKQIIEHWFKLYYDRMGSYPSIISAKNMGTIAGAANRGDTDKAIQVLTWQYTSGHSRAKYLQSKGMFDPAVTLSASRINDNYSMAMAAEAPALVPVASNLRFDEEGNLL
jgi:hypothetical protein